MSSRGLPPSGAEPPTPTPARRRSRRTRALVAAGLAVALASIVGYLTVVSPSSDTPVRVASPTTTTAPPTPADVYETILPSLVLIHAQRNPASATGTENVGSGVVVNAEGLIMTANHVVRGATAVQVTFADGTKSNAAVVSSQPADDIAVLRAERAPSVIVPAVLGSDRAVKIGDATFSAGNPLGLTASFTAGVISGLGRTVPIGDGTTTLQGVIQFDAAVNPGSSGGPLLNARGQVIGIVTGLANPTNQDVFIGVGFAVPIGTAGGAAPQPPR